ncbi:hypothetical protein MPSEU_000260600 [Mayamaea pseudoterrestris]|nr:hypothetical protein MPSEU_000260600 [Mayamaea pseudoterrestris]
MQFSSALSLLLLAPMVQCWVSPSTARVYSMTTTTTTSSSKALQAPLYATPVDQAEAVTSPSTAPSADHSDNHSTNTAVASHKPPLDSDFQSALDELQETLTQACPPHLQSKMLPLLLSFADEYMRASQQSYRAGTIAANPKQSMQQFLKGVQYGLEFGVNPDTKYQFDVSHQALRGYPETENGNTVDYYAFGCDFFRPMMNLQQSVILGQDYLQQAMDQVAAGDNVVLFANHQSEADPQVVSCCFEVAGYADQASEMIYVAGHKVTTDPLAIPFSMGRNLLCIHSKKHIDADPDTKATKQRQNIKAMNSLLQSFKSGGALVWVAPSGGRDRRNVETNEIPIAPFDGKTLDIFRLYANKSGVKTHYYTLAMVSYTLCPPPDFVEAGVGEARQVRFEPVGIHMGAELESVGGLEGRQQFLRSAMEQCERDYQTLLSEIEVKQQQEPAEA